MAAEKIIGKKETKNKMKRRRGDINIVKYLLSCSYRFIAGWDLQQALISFTKGNGKNDELVDGLSVLPPRLFFQKKVHFHGQGKCNRPRGFLYPCGRLRGT